MSKTKWVTLPLVPPEREWTWTPHAERRRAEMGLTREQVIEVLNDPENDYPQDKYGPHQRCAQKGDLAVAYADDTGSIITVVWRDPAHWEQRKAQGLSR